MIRTDFNKLYKKVIENCIWGRHEDGKLLKQVRNEQMREHEPSTSRADVTQQQIEEPKSPESSDDQSSNDERRSETSNETTSGSKKRINTTQRSEEEPERKKGRGRDPETIVRDKATGKFLKGKRTKRPSIINIEKTNMNIETIKKSMDKENIQPNNDNRPTETNKISTEIQTQTDEQIGRAHV